MELQKYHWLNETSKNILENGYLLPGTTIEDTIERIARTVAEYHKDHFTAETLETRVYQRVKYFLEYGCISLSSPVWANFGVSTKVRKGLPISCFGTQVEDSVGGIVQAWAESSMEGSLGGGTSTYWGEVRGRGEEISGGSISEGSFSFLPMFEGMVKTISQGGVRRGQMAVYQDVEHKDIAEWLNIYKEGNPIQTMVYGVCIGDEWMNQMIDGDNSKRQIWGKILDNREKYGLPFLFFRDNADKNKPEIYKLKQRAIKASNMCTEIMLPYAFDESFVCCLASFNLAVYDFWKDSDIYQVMTLILDAVLSEFIEKASLVEHMFKTVNFAKRHRAIGAGLLGWHSYLQSKSMAFEDVESIFLAGDISADIRDKMTDFSEQMVKVYGYERPEIFEGTDIYMRHATLTAIAPTKSSSGILGQVSLGIEPYETNYFVKDLAKVKSTYRNPYLEACLEKHGKNNEGVWASILQNFGSVQHLEFLTPKEKKVFKTFAEIPQLSILQQATARQRSICQGQSINVKILPSTTAKEVSQFYIEAWRLGLPSMYYQYNVNAAQVVSNNSLDSCGACHS